jgi:UDP-N-acetylmuramate--alanine ligase
MEKKGEVSRVTVYDDYGHHPREIQATLQGLRAAVNERRIIVLYQPHRYSRMKHVLDEFASVFAEADHLFITDIYTAGEKAVPGVTVERICENIEKSNRLPVQYVGRQNVIEELRNFVRPHDVVITFGAGDTPKIANDLVEELKKRPATKLKVNLIFGGMNCEHEVSCISMKHFAANLRPDLYDVAYFQIGLDGKFRKCNDAFQPITEAESILTPQLFGELADCDLFFPVLHGPYGEDGTIQGFFETLRKPYVGCDVRSCAASMDKAIMKSIALMHNIATVPFLTFDRSSWKEKTNEIVASIKQQLALPLFVKPTHLGSSVGITKVDSYDALAAAIDRAFLYDTHLLVEQGVQAREIEFAVCGNMRIQVPPPGEVLTNGQFYTYEAKYGANSCASVPVATLTKEQIEVGRRLAEQIYRAASCQGLARVDFFLDQQGKYWFNEINPLPGFTPISLYPKIWQEKLAQEGLPFTDLIDQLIILALERFRLQEAIFSYSCKALGRE